MSGVAFEMGLSRLDPRGVVELDFAPLGVCFDDEDDADDRDVPELVALDGGGDIDALDNTETDGFVSSRAFGRASLSSLLRTGAAGAGDELRPRERVFLNVFLRLADKRP